MNKIHQYRLLYIILFGFMISFATGLILYALKKNINVFLTPSQITFTAPDYHFRLGGMVKKGSVLHNQEKMGISFIVTDFKKELKVRYVGILPDLFREGKGVIADGNLNLKGEFIANSVLAKHDENYSPSNVSIK